MHNARSSAFNLAVALGALLFALPTQAATPGATPAATLLLPYFEVDLSGADALTTLFSVNNAGEDPVVTHVVLWTDWGIPTYSFDVVLGPDDVQTFNLRDLFRDGSVPTTDAHGIAGCHSPVLVPPLDAAALDALRLRHSGQPDPDDGLCYGSGRLGPNRVTGYVTVDVANYCVNTHLFFPTDTDYFFSSFPGLPPDPFAARDNVLWGDAFYVASEDDSAQGVEFVQIPFDPDIDIVGQTFYHLYAPGTLDGRTLLGSRYRGRFLNGGAFDGGTDLLVWLEGDRPSEPVECGRRRSTIDACQSVKFDLFDEGGALLGSTTRDISVLAFRLEVGGEELPTTTPFGFFQMDHSVLEGCVILPIGVSPVQAWVTPVMKAEGRYSVALPATRIPVVE